MGTGTILVIGGLLLVIGWLVWNNPLVKGGVKMVSDPRFKQLIEDRQSGRISEAQLEEKARALGQQYKKELGLFSKSYLARYKDTVSI